MRTSYPGPARSSSILGTLEAAGDGLYRAVPGPEVDGLPPTLTLHWDGRHRAACRLFRKGRPVVLVTYDREPEGDWRFGVEWIDPALVFAERRYDRLDPLFRLDRAFGGAIAAADLTGYLAQAAALSAAGLGGV